MAKSNAEHNAAMLANGLAARGQLIASHDVPIDETIEWSPGEQATLIRCEERIGALGKALWEAGEAFRTIHDQQLHRRYGLTWVDYCWEVWGQHVSYVNRLMRSAPIQKAGAPFGLRGEGPARELTAVYDARGSEGVVEILEGFKEADTRPTAAALKEIVAELPRKVPHSVNLRDYTRARLASAPPAPVADTSDDGDGDDAAIVVAELVDDGPAELSPGQVALINEQIKTIAARHGVEFVVVAAQLLGLVLDDGSPVGVALDERMRARTE